MDKYEKGEKLGEGQFGHVIKARVKEVRSQLRWASSARKPQCSLF